MMLLILVLFCAVPWHLSSSDEEKGELAVLQNQELEVACDVVVVAGWEIQEESLYWVFLAFG